VLVAQTNLLPIASILSSNGVNFGYSPSGIKKKGRLWTKLPRNWYSSINGEFTNFKLNSQRYIGLHLLRPRCPDQSIGWTDFQDTFQDYYRLLTIAWSTYCTRLPTFQTQPHQFTPTSPSNRGKSTRERLWAKRNSESYFQNILDLRPRPDRPC
jgi:hypothetical protein